MHHRRLGPWVEESLKYGANSLTDSSNLHRVRTAFSHVIELTSQAQFKTPQPSRGIQWLAPSLVHLSGDRYPRGYSKASDSKLDPGQGISLEMDLLFQVQQHSRCFCEMGHLDKSSLVLLSQATLCPLHGITTTISPSTLRLEITWHSTAASCTSMQS